MPINTTIINSPVFAYSNKPKGFFVSGELRFTYGLNNNVSRTILVHGDGFAVVRVAYPSPITEGDTFDVWTGCDKTGNTCATRFTQSNPNTELIVDGGFDDGSKWTFVGGWIISGSKTTHNDSTSNYSLSPVPQLTTVQANALYDISFTWQDLYNSGWAIDVMTISFGGVTFVVNMRDSTNFTKSIQTKTTAGLLITPCILSRDDLGYESYFTFDIDNLSITLGGTSPGNYANFFGFENIPRPEIML